MSRLLVQIPPRFLEMLATAPDLAREWRMQTRKIFTTYFARGYRIVDFLADSDSERGSYLLAPFEQFE